MKSSVPTGGPIIFSVGTAPFGGGPKEKTFSWNVGNNPCSLKVQGNIKLAHDPLVYSTGNELHAVTFSKNSLNLSGSFKNPDFVSQ